MLMGHFISRFPYIYAITETREKGNSRKSYSFQTISLAITLLLHFSGSDRNNYDRKHFRHPNRLVVVSLCSTGKPTNRTTINQFHIIAIAHAKHFPIRAHSTVHCSVEIRAAINCGEERARYPLNHVIDSQHR